MRLVRDILALALVASALVGMQLLLTDRWLWSTAPSHAYGLVGFVIVDILLTVALLENVGATTLAAAFSSLVQIGAMVGDLFFGQPNGVPSTAFRAYLIGDPSYSVLLIIKFAIVAVAMAGLTKPLLHRHAHWTGPVPRSRSRS